jgi:aminoglycoside 6'-N-acetyltransferase
MTPGSGAPDLPTLRGEVVALRPATLRDAPLLLAVVQTPEVARWWGDSDLSEIEKEIAEDDVCVYVIAVDGEVAGLIEYHEETEPMYRSAGIDIVLAPQFHDRGLGTDAVRTMARHLFEDRGHHRLTIDPAADNARAIATYAKVGFKPVGIMRQYERGLDGTWHDGLLMDMLREELVR